MKIKNETEIQLMKILFKTSGKKPTKNITSQRAYPHGVEMKYFRQLKGFFKPLTDYVNKYINENLEPLLRGDSTELHLDTIPGPSFRNMIYNLENWLSIYMPDIADLPTDSNNNVIFTALGKTAEEAKAFGDKEFQKIIEKGIHVNVPTTSPWWDDMKSSWAENNYTLITSNAKKYVEQINVLTEQAIVNGLSPKKLKEEIMKATEGLSEKHCKLLARDQMGKLNGNITEAQMQEIGLDLYVWSTAYDDRVRDSHAVMEGLLCRWDDASVCSYDNGKTWVARPSGAVDLHPGQDIQCRCVALSFYPELEAEMEGVPMSELTSDLPDVQDLPQFQNETDVEYTEKEKEAVAYWTEGNEGWGYQNIRKLANGYPIEETPIVQEQLKINNNEKAKYLGDRLEEIYKNFNNAVNKSYAPKSEFLYRIVPDTNIPTIGESINLEKFTSFTFKPTDSFYNNFSHGNDTVMYIIKNSDNFADISKIGRDTLSIATQEFEAVSKKSMNYKVTGIIDKKINGKNYKIVSLEYEKTNKIIKKEYVPPKKVELTEQQKDFNELLKFQMKVMTEAMKRGIDTSDEVAIKKLMEELRK